MDFIAPIIVVFLLFMLCTCCGLACKRKREGAIFSTPVVVVSEQHQPTGGYPVTVQHHNASMAQQGMQGGAYPMPAAHTQMPMPPPNYGQYGGNAAPYPTNAPYPMGMPQPAVMPMPPNPNQNPPSYNEVVGNEAYQKQAPFNPNFSS